MVRLDLLIMPMLMHIAIAYTDPTGKEPHAQIGVGWVITYGSLDSLSLSTLCRD